MINKKINGGANGNQRADEDGQGLQEGILFLNQKNHGCVSET